VRLARLLLARGEKGEAQRLLQEVKTDAANLPRYLRREHRSWIWTARALRSGSARLPRPYVEGGEKPGRRLRLVLTAAAAVAVVVLLFFYASWEMKMQEQAREAAAREEAAAGDPAAHQR
jgi:hypothetical protein